MSALRGHHSRLLHEVIERAASANPTMPALIHGSRTFTFGELADRVHRAMTLVRQRTRPGDRVAVVGTNKPFWVDAYYAVPGCDRLLVFLTHRQSTRDLIDILRRTGTTLVIGSGDECERLAESPLELPHSLSTIIDDEQWEAQLRIATPSTADAIAETSAAWLIFTSGTTAAPKGVLLSHVNLFAAFEAAATSRPIRPDDIYLFPFPLCHVAGYNVIRHHEQCRPVVLLDGFAVEDFLAAAQATGATSTSLAATMATRLVDRVEADIGALRALRPLRTVAFGASATPGDLLRRVHDTLGVDLTQGYGMTELGGNAVFLDARSHQIGLEGEVSLLRAAGRPGPGVEVRTSSADGRPCSTGEPGEILVRAPQVMQGYWGDPASSREALREGWLHTGDVGYLDGDGLLYVTDRLKDVIVTGGENVSSLRVEDVLVRFPQVAAAAVIGRPHPTWGESLVAVVVPAGDEPIDIAALLAHVRQDLGGYQVPKEVIVVDEIPTNASGKVLKDQLRARFAAYPGRDLQRGDSAAS